MPDRYPPEPDGRTDPTPHDQGDAHLAASWDRRALARRGARQSNALPDAGPVVAQLEALARADGSSDPRPGFLDRLEADLMRTRTTPIAIAIEPRPSAPTQPPVLARRTPLRGRGLIDVLSVAAVVALLLGGSWFAFGQPGSAPTPDGGNGVGGVTTPDATPIRTDEDASRIVALDQPWVENLPVDAFGLGEPVGTQECTTPSREPGSVLVAVEAAYSIGGVATPTVEPLLADPGAIDPAAYPAAAPDDVVAVDVFLHQVSACRFSRSGLDGQAIAPYTGALWSLYATDTLASFPLSLPRSTPERVVEQAYEMDSHELGAWAYAARTIDVREFPPDGHGNPRLLVRSVGLGPLAGETLSLVVHEDGQWRFAAVRLLAADAPLSVDAQVANIRVGVGTLGPIPAGFGSQLEAGSPVALSIVNTGGTAQRVTLGGQDVGVVDPGTSIEIAPFVVRPEAVTAAGGRLSFVIESVAPDEIGNSEDRTLTIGVYPAGYVVDPRVTVATPEATPVVSQDQSGRLTPTVVAVALAPDEADRTVTLDQPWAEPVGEVYIEGSYPVAVSRCATPRRTTGSIVDLVAASPDRPAAELPQSLSATDVPDLLARYPDAGDAGLIAAGTYFEQLAACRFAVSPTTGPAEDLYTAPVWSLYSDAFLLRALPTEGRSAEGIVRQGLRFDTPIVQGPYVNTVEAVRAYPADRSGQARLLVAYHSPGSPGRMDLGVLVLERDVWRMDETTPVARSGPLSGQESAIRAVDIDLDRSTDVGGLIDVDLTDLTDPPIVLTIYNGTDRVRTISIAGQDLGRLAPGEALRVEPFIVLADRIPEDGLIDVPIVATDLDGTSESIRLRLHPSVQPAATPAA